VFVILTLLNFVVSLGPFLMLVLALGLLAVRHQRFFLVLFMLLVALNNTRDFAPDVTMTFSEVSVFPEDLVLILSAGASLARIGRMRLRGVTLVVVMALSLLVGAGVINWITSYGLEGGTNSWRSLMLAIVLTIYTSTRPRAWSWDDLQAIIVAPAIVVAIAATASMLLYGLGSSASTVQVGGVMEDGRPVLAPGALLMLMAFWVNAFHREAWTLSRLLIAALLGSMILLTQIRSVWVAAILGALAWWLVPRIRTAGFPRGLGGLSRTAFIFIAGGSTALIGVSLASIGQSASSGQTWFWRVARWTESMSIQRSWSEWLVGSALGPTPASTPSLFLTNAHSLFVNAIEMTGFIGLLATLYLVFAIRKAPIVPEHNPLGLVVCFSFLGFGVTYALLPWTWMIIGILLTWNQKSVTGEATLMIATNTRGNHPTFTTGVTS